MANKSKKSDPLGRAAHSKFFLQRIKQNAEAKRLHKKGLFRGKKYNAKLI